MVTAEFAEQRGGRVLGFFEIDGSVVGTCQRSPCQTVAPIPRLVRSCRNPDAAFALREQPASKRLPVLSTKRRVSCSTKPIITAEGRHSQP